MLTQTVVLQAVITGLLLGSIYSLMALGFSLIFGPMNIVNFAHGHLMIASMYLAFTLFQRVGLDPLFALPMIAVVMFVFGTGIYKLIIKRMSHADHSTHIIATVGISIILENVILLLYGGDVRAVNTAYSTSGFVIFGATISHARLIAALLSAVLVIALYLFLKKTYFGKGIRAVGDDMTGAQVVGIPIHKINGIAFGLGVGAAAMAGVVMVPFVQISPTFGIEYLTKSFIIVVLGGLGSVPGALIGAMILGFVEQVGIMVFPAQLINALVFAVLIVVLLLKPSGLFGEIKR
jgi:branched-chain amino acid transport system permease protein